MSNTFVNTNRSNGAHLQPRGLVPAPPEVVAHVAKIRSQFPPEIYTDEYAKLVLDDSTLAYYYAGQDVAYRSVPQGVEILAVGAEEIGELVKDKTQEEMLTFTIKEP
jgi:hypothetical protein